MRLMNNFFKFNCPAVASERDQDCRAIAICHASAVYFFSKTQLLKAPKTAIEDHSSVKCAIRTGSGM